MNRGVLVRCLSSLIVALYATAIAVPSVAQDARQRTQDAGPQAPDSRLIIEDIRCEGNRATSCAFIRTQLGFGPGSRVDEDKVRDAKLRLALRPIFRSIDIRLEKGSRRGLAILVVQVTEEAVRFSTSFAAGTLYSFNAYTQQCGP